MGWNQADIPDQSGRTAVITGGNGGLGEATAVALARAGARVILACRDTARGRESEARLGHLAPGSDCEVLGLDLADLESVRRAAAELAVSEPGGIDLLINNAGVMATPRRDTADGFELQMGTNHLGHFALTALVLPLLRARPGARVVTVSSQAHRTASDLDDLNSEHGYGRWRAYGKSKLANLLFAFELQRRLAAAGIEIESTAAHPGYSATHLQSSGPAMGGDLLALANTMAARLGNLLIAQRANGGALPILRAATDPNVSGGDYIGPGGPLEMRGPPRTTQARRLAYNREVATRLWDWSEELTGVGFNMAS